MKTPFLILFFLIVSVFATDAQSLISNSEWQNIINYLNNEQWEKANQLSRSYLQKIPKDKINESDAAILRYMYIRSESGLMNLDKVTQKQAFDHIKGFVGLNLILPGHPIALKEGFNSIEMLNNKADTLIVTATNKAATDILSFEYIILDKPFTVAEFMSYIDKICAISGRLKSIKIEGHILPRFNMIIDHAVSSFD